MAYWRNELINLKEFLENLTGATIEEGELISQIRIANEARRLLKEVVETSSGNVVPLSGMDVMTVMESTSFVVDRVAYMRLLRELVLELKNRIRGGDSVCGAHAPRILLTGCTVGKGSERFSGLLKIVAGSWCVRRIVQV